MHSEFDPIDAVGRRRRLGSWRPKKWRPEYERMVAYSCCGWSNIMIAKELGYTKEHVSTILNMEQAEAVRIELLQRMRATTLKAIPENLEYVAQRAGERLRTMIDDEELYQRSPFQVIDRGLEVIKGLAYLKGGGNGSPGVTVNVNTAVLSSDQADTLAQALNKSNEVKVLHGEK